jgi:hypothetical protein
MNNALFTKRFNKAIAKYWRSELGWHYFCKTNTSRKAYRLLLALKLYPKHKLYVLNIYRALEVALANPERFKNTHKLKLAIKLWKKHKKQWLKHFNAKYANKPKKRISAKKALEVQKALGFKYTSQLLNFNPDLPYIRSNIHRNLVWPKQSKQLQKMYQLQPLVGIEGYTAVEVPKKFLQ